MHKIEIFCWMKFNFEINTHIWDCYKTWLRDFSFRGKLLLNSGGYIYVCVCIIIIFRNIYIVFCKGLWLLSVHLCMSSVDKLRNMDITGAAIPLKDSNNKDMLKCHIWGIILKGLLAPKSVSKTFVTDMEIYKVECSLFVF